MLTGPHSRSAIRVFPCFLPTAVGEAALVEHDFECGPGVVCLGEVGGGANKVDEDENGKSETQYYYCEKQNVIFFFGENKSLNYYQEE